MVIAECFNYFFSDHYHNHYKFYYSKDVFSLSKRHFIETVGDNAYEIKLKLVKDVSKTVIFNFKQKSKF